MGFLDPGRSLEAIYRYIEKQAFEGFLADATIIAAKVGLLVRLRTPDYTVPSSSWLHQFTHTKQFRARLRSVKSKPIDHKRKTATDQIELQKWMRDYRRVLQREQILCDS